MPSLSTSRICVERPSVPPIVPRIASPLLIRSLERVSDGFSPPIRCNCAMKLATGHCCSSMSRTPILGSTPCSAVNAASIASKGCTLVAKPSIDTWSPAASVGVAKKQSPAAS